MVRSNRNRRVRRRTRTTTVARQTALAVRRSERSDIGCSFVPGVDPPEFSDAPWWPYTCVWRSSIPVNVTWAVLHKTILENLGLTTDSKVNFNIRLLTVRLWGLNRQVITVDIYTGTTGGCKKLKQLTDCGSNMNYSRLGWRYGRASYAMLDHGCADSTQTLFFLGGAITSTNQVLVYAEVLLQLIGVPSPKVQLNRNNTCSDFEMLHI